MKTVAPPVVQAPLRGEPLPAELANTEFADRGEPVDALTSPADLARWLRLHRDCFDVPVSNGDLQSVTPGQVQTARRLRVVVRSLADRPGSLSRSAVTTLNDVISCAPRYTQLRGTPARLVPATSATAVDAALAQVAEETATLVVDSRAEIRQCAAPGCVLLFVRRGGQREWCSPECGNRARVLRHYQRHSRRAR